MASLFSVFGHTFYEGNRLTNASPVETILFPSELICACARHSGSLSTNISMSILLLTMNDRVFAFTHSVAELSLPMAPPFIVSIHHDHAPCDLCQWPARVRWILGLTSTSVSSFIRAASLMARCVGFFIGIPLSVLLSYQIRLISS